MRKEYYVFCLFLCLSIKVFAQSEEKSKPTKIELKANDLTKRKGLRPLGFSEDVKWLATCPENIDWEDPESFLNYIGLFPLDDELPDIDEPFRGSFHIFSFNDSLKIQTYNPITKQLGRTVSYKIEPIENSYDSFWVHISESEVMSFYATNIYDHHYTISCSFRVPLDDPQNNAWVTADGNNTENCIQFSKNKSLAQYTLTVENTLVNHRNCTQFQIFTFGEELVVETYDKIKEKVIKIETFKYTDKDGDPYTKLVYFSDFKAELQAYLTYDYGKEFRYLVMKCVD